MQVSILAELDFLVGKKTGESYKKKILDQGKNQQETQLAGHRAGIELN